MKQIIKGKVYDTMKSYIVGWRMGDFHDTDPKYFEEWLYKKRTGEYFMVGEGGAMSAYAKTCEDGSLGYGKKIIPMSYQEANEWATAHMTRLAYRMRFLRMKLYQVIGGQYESRWYGESDSLRGAKRLARKHQEYWDNWQGWHTPAVYHVYDVDEITMRDGRTTRVPTGYPEWKE